MTTARSERSDPRRAVQLADVRDLIRGTGGGALRLPLLSGSMAPALLPGDILLVRSAPGHRAHMGDVAVFLKDGRLTVHRIVFALRLFSWAFLLEMGDANEAAAPLNQSAVLGIVDQVEREGARIPFARGARDEEARRRARAMLWRFLVGVLPAECLKRMIGK